MKVKSYRIEEIRLSSPVEVGNDAKVRVEGAIRLTVTGGPFILGEYTIWIDYMTLPATSMKNNTELSAGIYGPATFPDEATISVSHGTGCNSDMESVLHEKLITPARLKSKAANQY